MMALQKGILGRSLRLPGHTYFYVSSEDAKLWSELIMTLQTEEQPVIVR